MYQVYILYSHSLDRYYVGQTLDLDDRIKRHNTGNVKSTKRGCPWMLKCTFAAESRGEAMRLEKRIKGRGIARYLEDHGM